MAKLIDAFLGILQRLLDLGESFDDVPVTLVDIRHVFLYSVDTGLDVSNVRKNRAFVSSFFPLIGFVRSSEGEKCKDDARHGCDKTDD